MLVQGRKLTRGACRCWCYVGEAFRYVRYPRSAPMAGNPRSMARHCGLLAAVKAGVGGSAAAHHAGASLVTITRASNYLATERPSFTLRPFLRAPTAAGRALARSGAVHRVNIAFTTSLPEPWRPPPPCVENHWGDVNPHPAAGIRAFQAFLFPFFLQEVGGAAAQGPDGDWVRLENCQFHREFPSPSPRLRQNVSSAASVSGDVQLAVMRNSGLDKDLAEEGLCAEVHIPKSRILT